MITHDKIPLGITCIFQTNIFSKSSKIHILPKNTMSNTYTQLFIHIVFAPMHKAALIKSDFEEELYKYITGIAKNHRHKLLCINGTEDHIHILIGLNPEQSISVLVQEIKKSSSKWINDRHLCLGRFEWQREYGAFTYSKSHVKQVIKYIENQKSHHRKISFLDEYKFFLKKYEVEYNPNFVFVNPRIN